MGTGFVLQAAPDAPFPSFSALGGGSFSPMCTFNQSGVTLHAPVCYVSFCPCARDFVVAKAFVGVVGNCVPEHFAVILCAWRRLNLAHVYV